jgi:heme/copper-type cytochrome/quinol oxidase subunit 2
MRLRLLLALLGLAVVLVPLPNRIGQPTERLFRVDAAMFAYSPSVLTASPGDTVIIELVATDVVHGLYVDGYDVSVSADPGNTSRMSFVADRAGSFRFRCSVTCGPLHPFMIGVLKVGPNWLLWRAGALALVAAAFGIAAART